MVQVKFVLRMNFLPNNIYAHYSHLELFQFDGKTHAMININSIQYSVRPH